MNELFCIRTEVKTYRQRRRGFDAGSPNIEIPEQTKKKSYQLSRGLDKMLDSQFANGNGQTVGAKVTETKDARACK